MVPAAARRTLLVGFDLDLTLVDSRVRIGTCLTAALVAAGVDVVVGGRSGAGKGEVLREIGATDVVAGLSFFPSWLDRHLAQPSGERPAPSGDLP